MLSRQWEGVWAAGQAVTHWFPLNSLSSFNVLIRNFMGRFITMIFRTSWITTLIRVFLKVLWLFNYLRKQFPLNNLSSLQPIISKLHGKVHYNHDSWDSSITKLLKSYGPLFISEDTFDNHNYSRLFKELWNFKGRFITMISLTSSICAF